MKSAVIGAAAALTGKTWTPEARAQQAAKEAAEAASRTPNRTTVRNPSLRTMIL